VNWRTIVQALKAADMRKRLLAVLGMILVFRVLAHIPIPLAEPTELKQIIDNLLTSTQTSQALGFFDILSGGAFSTLAITLVGISPYISASVIMQLLTKAIPKLETLNKEGEFGRRKINQFTRLLTFPLAVVQSIGVVFVVRQTATQLGGVSLSAISLSQWILMISALTAVAMIVMWLGELITEQGVAGQGISLIVTVGIVSGLPGIISDLLNTVIDQSQKLVIAGKTLPIDMTGLIYALVIGVLTLLITIAVVKLNEAQRRLTINYAKRVQGNRAYGGITSVLPIKLISAGVVPFIFAQAFLAVPDLLSRVFASMSSVRLQELGATLSRLFRYPDASTFAQPGFEPYVYPLVYLLLIVVFTYFYTNVIFNAKELAEGLQKQGGFISDIRAGKQTEQYLSRVVNRLNLFGAFCLGFLALLPIMLQWGFLKFFNISINQIAIGGTSILILVAVALETLRQIESRAMMVTFEMREYAYEGAAPTLSDGRPKRSRRFSAKKLFTKKPKA
jgi:preprotein translocase subunit SecY